MEEWKDVVGFEGSYKVSNLGRIKSFKRSKDGLIVKGSPAQGYIRVKLREGSGYKRIFAHRLVAEAFIGRVSGKDYVDHIDSDKLNNNAENLRWCTNRENTCFATSKRKTSSKYTGVVWRKKEKKWYARITFGKTLYFIDAFDIEEDARDAYLDILENGVFKIHTKYRRK
tara:strand:+ start:530 stop:1039 length:510 start_codon:yes stop_codon:yes gene_type:complete